MDRLAIGKFRDYRHKIISTFPPQAVSHVILIIDKKTNKPYVID